MKIGSGGVAGANKIAAFGRAIIALPGFVADRIFAQRNAITLDQSPPGIQIEAALGLQNFDARILQRQRQIFAPRDGLQRFARKRRIGNYVLR